MTIKCDPNPSDLTCKVWPVERHAGTASVYLLDTEVETA
jgi:hypothetical protein